MATILALIVLFVGPAIWPFLIRRVRSSERHVIGLLDPIPVPWDKVFARREPYWVIAHLQDGRRIGGRYGVNSFTSPYPSDPSLHLEAVWMLSPDGSLDRAVEQSAGIMSLPGGPQLVELFKYAPDRSNGDAS